MSASGWISEATLRVLRCLYLAEEPLSVGRLAERVQRGRRAVDVQVARLLDFGWAAPAPGGTGPAGFVLTDAGIAEARSLFGPYEP